MTKCKYCTIILLLEDIIWNVISNWLLGTAKIKQTPHDSCGAQYKNSKLFYNIHPVLFAKQTIISACIFLSVFIQNSKSNRVLAFIFVKLNLGTRHAEVEISLQHQITNSND